MRVRDRAMSRPRAWPYLSFRAATAGSGCSAKSIHSDLLNYIRVLRLSYAIRFCGSKCSTGSEEVQAGVHYYVVSQRESALSGTNCVE